MPGMSRNSEDGRKLPAAGVWITFSLCLAGVFCQEGDSCGHSFLGAESGTLASPNYPGTYPSNAWCKWRLRVQEGRTLRLLFGDFDIESSPGCRNGSIVITGKSGERRLGPVCGKLNATMSNVTLETNEVTLTFMSGPHRSGRGFQLSYATDQHPDLITCLQRGSHFSVQHLSVYCPAGCQNVPGDVWGNSEQGYRDTSVLCKAAVHSGATSDAWGGRVTVNQGRSLTLYESAFANGILSKMGSLSDKKLLFSRECNNILTVSAVNASSFWDKSSQEHTVFSASRNTETSHDFLVWTADSKDPNPWVEVELAERSTVTGLVTTGTLGSYIETYSLQFSKDRKSWKTYKDSVSKEKKVFQAYTDGHLRVLNNLFPAVVARHVRLQPLRWHGRASARVQLLGCSAAKATPRSRAPLVPPSVKFNMDTLKPSSSPIPTERTLFVETTKNPSQTVIIAVGVVLGLVMCGSCLFAGIWWKRRKTDSRLKNALPTVGSQDFKMKSLPCPRSELISYPLVRNVHDALPSPPLNDYAAPAVTAVGQKVGSTFRPSSDKGYTTPFTRGHYHTPGNLPEYADPLPPEPEYATPFSELPPEHKPSVLTRLPHRTPAQAPSIHSQYDCPSHRVLFNGYCTPALHAGVPRPASGVYAEPKSSDCLVQKHTYEEPL